MPALTIGQYLRHRWIWRRPWLLWGVAALAAWTLGGGMLALALVFAFSIALAAANAVANLSGRVAGSLADSNPRLRVLWATLAFASIGLEFAVWLLLFILLFAVLFVLPGSAVLLVPTGDIDTAAMTAFTALAAVATALVAGITSKAASRLLAGEVSLEPSDGPDGVPGLMVAGVARRARDTAWTLFMISVAFAPAALGAAWFVNLVAALVVPVVVMNARDLMNKGVPLSAPPDPYGPTPRADHPSLTVTGSWVAVVALLALGVGLWVAAVVVAPPDELVDWLVGGLLAFAGADQVYQRVRLPDRAHLPKWLRRHRVHAARHRASSRADPPWRPAGAELSRDRSGYVPARLVRSSSPVVVTVLPQGTDPEVVVVVGDDQGVWRVMNAKDARTLAARLATASQGAVSA